jgi:hypothetical protein
LSDCRLRLTKISELWGWRGTISRGRYALFGGVLLGLKHNLDRVLAAVYDRSWNFLDYWVPSSLAVDELPADERRFFAAMLVLAVPFLWIGLLLTVRRLRDAGLPLWLVTLFFVPVVNVLFFLVLCVVPSRIEDARELHGRALLDRIIPRNPWGSAALGLLLVGVLSTVFAFLSVEVLASYGWGLFVGVPFALGLLSVLIYGYHEPQSASNCVYVSVFAVVLAGAALVAVAFEGAICLLMAAPIATPIAVMGGLVGYLLQRRPGARVVTGSLYCAVCFALPPLMLVEVGAGQHAEVIAVRTSVVVDAPPHVVWRRVIAFPPLPPPRGVLRTGIAYPTSARIDGVGVGAVRHCVFSTGEFVEPITAWEPGRLLRFDVVSQPPPLRELSPYDGIEPPHLDDFLDSERGEFRLEPLPGGRTRLIGTTWYRNRMWPARYWQLYSDRVIHRIHRRVLDHVRTLAERDVTPSERVS